MILLSIIPSAIIFWCLFYLIEVKDQNWLKIVGLPFDILWNFGYGTILFMAFPDILHNPRQWTFSKRLQAYYYQETWRGQIARFICEHFLEPFLPGHCKNKG